MAPWLDRDRKSWEVVTLVIVGERLWRESCHVAGVEDLCAEREPAEGGCSPPGERLVIRRRDAGAERARMHFRGALQRYERGALSGGEAEEAVAIARLRLADDQLEGAIALAFPRGLDFEHDEPRSLEKLAAFRREVDGRALGARRAYGSLAGTPVAVPALAREALLFAHVGALVRRAELPRRPDADDADAFMTGFCETMAELAMPWEEGATRLREACVEEAARRGEAPRVCR
jgi:hypothetical protein